MPTPTIAWNLNANGNWATTADWTPHRLPTSTDNVAINTASLHTVTHSKGTDTVNTLTVGNDNLVVSGGSLAIKSTSSFAHALTVSGGTLALGGNATAASFSQRGGTVSGSQTLTVTGAANFNSYSLVQTGPGTTLLEGNTTFTNNAVLNLDGGRVLENRGTLNLSQLQGIDLGANPLGPVLGGATLKNDAGGTIILGGASYIAHGAGAVAFTNAGTIVESAANSGATVGVSLSNTGQIQAQSGELALFGFTNSGPGSVSVDGGASVDIFDGGSAGAGAFTVASGANLNFFSNNLGDPGTGGVFSLGAGTIGGTGTVNLLGDGELALGSGAVTIANFTQSSGTVSGSGTLTLMGAAHLGGVESGPGRTLLAASSTFSLGDLNVVGGRFLENQGATGVITANIQLGDSQGSGTFENDAGGSITFTGALDILGATGSFINAGSLEKLKLIREHNPPDTTVAVVGVDFTDTGAIKIDGGTLEFTGPANTFDGSISGVGGLSFGAGTSALNNGAITTSSLSISGAAVVDLNANLNFSGGFSQTAGTLNVAAGDTATLAGLSSLTGTVGGAGTVSLSSATVSGLTVGGTSTLNDVGTVVQSGIVTIGDASANAATLSIAAGATFTIENGSDIARGHSLASAIDNRGLLIKSGGTGTSVVGVGINDAGTIEAASGTLDLTQAITGGGTLAVDAGATLELGFSAASTLALNFNGGNGTLVLGNPAQFAATINGFDATDTIQLVGRQATTATLGGADSLTITDGSTTVATLQLAGNFAGDTFNVASDGGGGTIVTVTTPALSRGLPGGGGALPNDPAIGSSAQHRFVAAMAGLGAGSADAVHAAADAWRASPSMLAAPRMHMA